MSPFWGNNAIDIQNMPTISHNFRLTVVGEGWHFKNLSGDYRRTFIRINQVGIGKDFKEFILLTKELTKELAEDIDYLVDTGATISIFKSQIAEALDLKPEKGKIDFIRVNLATGEKYEGWWSIHKICLGIGRLIPMSVMFAVKQVKSNGENKYEYIADIPRQNILGMEGLINQRMLCFTPERLFVFSRL